MRVLDAVPNESDTKEPFVCHDKCSLTKRESLAKEVTTGGEDRPEWAKEGKVDECWRCVSR